MKSALCVAMLLAAACTGCLADTGSSPLPKVLKLLEGLKFELVKDGEAATTRFKARQEWCRKGNADLTYDIAAEAGDVEDDEAAIAKTVSDISMSSARIEDEAATSTQAQAELKAAKEMRATESTQFKAAEKELIDSVSTLERASNVLQRKLRGAGNGAAFLQTTVAKNDIKTLMQTLDLLVNAASLSIHDKNKLTSLVQDSESEDGEEEMDAIGAPEADVYKTHDRGISDLLEDLKQKAESQLTALRTQEQNAKHNFEALQASLLDQNKVANNEIGEARSSISVASQVKALANGDLAVVNKELASDKSSLRFRRVDCKTVAAEFETTQQSSSDEMAAIDGALAALKEVGVTGYASSLVQLGNSDPTHFEVVNILRKLAEVQRSPALTQLAGRVSTAMTLSATRGVDPFTKVRAMVEGMVASLQREAAAESQHKTYCDKEMKESKAKKGELTHGIDKFTARMDQAKAKVGGMKEEVAVLSRELAALAADQGEADQLRRDELAAYKTSKANLQQGGTDVAQAIKVLNKFYARTALLQQASAGRTAHSAQGTSIIGILEVAQSKMDLQLRRVEREETAAAAAYKKVTDENTLAKHTKDETVKYKTTRTTSLMKTISEYASDLDGSESEMDAVLQYATNIKSMCDTSSVESYEERAARRQGELEGLKAALNSLERENVSLVQDSFRRGAVVAKHV